MCCEDIVRRIAIIGKLMKTEQQHQRPDRAQPPTYLDCFPPTETPAEHLFKSNFVRRAKIGIIAPSLFKVDLIHIPQCVTLVQSVINIYSLTSIDAN